MPDNKSINRIPCDKFFEDLVCGAFRCSMEGRFLDANPALISMLGYNTKNEFLKINGDKNIYLKPDERKHFQKEIEENEHAVNFEMDLICRDKKIISTLFTGHGFFDHKGNIIGYEGIVVDQSQRKKREKELKDAHDFLKDKVLGYEGIIMDQYQEKQMEKELKEAHGFLNKVIQSSPNVIVATDLKGNIIIMNKVAEETLGYNAREIIGKMNIRKLYPEGVADEMMELLRSPEYGGEGRLISYPIVKVSQNGTTVEGNLAAALIYDPNGIEIACVYIFTDLTERLEMERKLRQIQEKLLQSEKLAAMGRLTSQIAHELNNPLFGIMNTLELMKSEIPRENKRRKILEMALSETVRLSDLLQKMLSFSKPDQKEKKSINVNIILDEILLLHEKQLQERNIRVDSVFSEDLKDIYASKDQLRQVFLNMISNSRDAMPLGGLLSVRTNNNSDNIRIELSDTGVGIQKENINRIFDAFYTTKDTVKGVGLGLSVCYGVIREHGGDIKVQSKPDFGTTFTIIFPIHKESS